MRHEDLTADMSMRPADMRPCLFHKGLSEASEALMLLIVPCASWTEVRKRKVRIGKGS